MSDLARRPAPACRSSRRRARGCRRRRWRSRSDRGQASCICEVSTSLPPRCCSHGLPSGPCGVIASRSLAPPGTPSDRRSSGRARRLRKRASPRSCAMVRLSLPYRSSLCRFFGVARGFGKVAPLPCAAPAPCAECDRGNQNETLRRVLERLRQPSKVSSVNSADKVSAPATAPTSVPRPPINCDASHDAGRYRLEVRARAQRRRRRRRSRRA